MQIVIDICEYNYKSILKGKEADMDETEVIDAVKNGVVLPKGHGDLVDLKEVIDAFWDGNFMEIYEDDLAKINVVVKADKEATDGGSD